MQICKSLANNLVKKQTDSIDTVEAVLEGSSRGCKVIVNVDVGDKLVNYVRHLWYADGRDGMFYTVQAYYNKLSPADTKRSLELFVDQFSLN